MIAWKRFPVPEFDYEPFVDMAYEAPKVLPSEEIDGLVAKLESGDESVCGAYAVAPPQALLEQHAFQGEDCHAIAVLLPAKPVQLLGRSHAWRVQRSLILAGTDPKTADVVHDWKTPRPMNTRLGPDDGVIVEGGGAFLILLGHKYADHWVGNRIIIENDWDPGENRNGFRILANSDPDLDDFHHSYLAFDWSA